MSLSESESAQASSPVGSNRLTILQGDALDRLRELPSESVQCCVTSPPYWGLRDYQVAGQLGLEKTPAEYVAKTVAVFSEVRRVLKNDGTLWLNLGDSYNAYNGNAGPGSGFSRGAACDTERPKLKTGHGLRTTTLKPKDLIGIPWSVAFALREDGWYLRQDIIWAKPNPMPESVTDRPTRSHEYIFLLSKSKRYYYDSDAIRETPSPALLKQVADGYSGSAVKDFFANGVQNASDVKTRIIEGCRKRINKQRGHSRTHAGFNARWDDLTKEEQMACGSNKKSVWTVAPFNFRDEHFATFPPELIRPCILAGCPTGGIVLDCFAGSGTTGQVALELGRKVVLIELNPAYIELIKQRCDVTPGLNL